MKNASDTNTPKKRIVILGGGFGGVFAARQLSKYISHTFEVELINDRNYFVFQPLLPEVAAGGITASDAISPIRQLLPKVTFRQAEVIGINFEARKVTVIQGTRRLPVDVDYDHLVLAMGQSVDLSRFPGVQEHALTMKNMADAFLLRNHIIDCLEKADITRVPEFKKELLTFTVVGAGFSGVETMGEIKDLIDRATKYYKNIKKDEIRFLLIEYADRILLELKPELADYARRKLEKRGIQILNGVGTKSATGRHVELTDGNIIETRTLVATIGNGPNKLISKLPLTLANGKIQVDRYLRVPEYQNVWAIGDAALIPLCDNPGNDRYNYAPPTAQFAVREGKQVAINIVNTIKDVPLKPFAYKAKGALASLGMSKAVAQVFKIRLTGFFAWLLWRGFYVSFLPGMATRIRVLVNWGLNGIIPRNIVQTQPQPGRGTRYIRYRKDEEVFEPGMFADGFYIVLEGSFKFSEINQKTGETLTQIIHKGGHFAEQAILRDDVRMGYVHALEDSYVLWMTREDFKNIATHMPLLKDYFEKYPQHIKENV